MRLASIGVVLALASACSQDPGAFTTPLTTTATPGANGCALSDWPTAPDPAIAIDLITGRHDGTELVIAGATGAYLTSIADDNKLIGDYTGDALSVTRLGTRRLTTTGACGFRAAVTFTGTTVTSTTLSGTLTYAPYEATETCDATCTSTITFTSP